MRCSLVLAVVSVGLLGASACVVELPDRPKDGGKLLDGAVRDAISDAAGKDHKTVLPPGCGDGKLGDGETCDVAIAAGDTGMCPTACDDGLACTEDTLRNGGTCKASCDYPAITGCADGDGCCPGGCTADEDNDCSRDCGNSKIDDKETCDTGIAAGQAGACPMEADCNDGSSCTTDTLLNPETCGAQCSHTPIVACTNGDGCCPTGCTTKTDDDCSVTCGDGVKDEVEKCDTAIAKGQPGACPSPADCEDGKACTIDKLLNPGSCNAQCSSTAITQCASGDGCCPSGCTNNNDTDCSVSCHNGAVEKGETCDTAIAAGKPGACPTSCSDGKVCTKDTLQNGGTCTASCIYTAIESCTTGDGCCPNGCNNNTDNDCSVTCHNGAVEKGETCDTAIAAGKPGACPTSCNDGKVCTKDKLQNGGTCTAECVFTSITICVNSDGCCPAACNANNDNDCSPVCGNGVVESGEICDKGISAGNPGACPTSCAAKTCKKWALTGLTASCSRTCTYSNDDNATCSGGTCHGGSCCQGCWNGSCQVGTSLTVCGHAGGSCASCSDSNACTDDSCASGTCKNTNDDTNTCSGGTCHGGSCCTGCWNGSSCLVGTKVGSCGKGGVLCASCGSGPGGVCEPATCTSGICGYADALNGTLCTGGKCYSGSCCTGCWNGTSCQVGTSLTACGGAGASCDNCDVPVAPCQEHYCSVSKTPTCATRNIADNTSCSSGSGRCHSGSCCTGCWDPTHAICESGLEQFACGNGGNTCDVCSSGECCNNNHFCWPTYKGDCGPM